MTNRLEQKRFFSARLDLRELKEDGTFEGYGSVFNVVDSYGTAVAPGAFAETLRTKGAKGVRLLWQHDSEQPIGVYPEMYEDKTGLFVKGKLALKTQRGAECYELMQMGAIDGLSIGFMPVKWEVDEEQDLITFTELDLWEISPVTFPANDSARISAVRAFSAGAMPEPKILERALREAVGLSRQEARAFMAQGLDGLRSLRDAGGDVPDHSDEMAAKIKAAFSPA